MKSFPILKQALATLLICINSFNGFTQHTHSETEKIATFCKVWGFLKYYHPQVSKGKYDWDHQLIEKLPLVKSCNTKEDVCRVYIDWIRSLGKIKTRKNLTDSTSRSFTKNLNIGWINDTTLFNPELIAQLNYIKDNRARHHYYVQKNIFAPYFEEKQYNDSVFPSEGLRMVGLFRYWNIINYFAPYKYLTDHDWNDVLIEMIPEFQSPIDTIAYHRAMYKLVSRLDDSHAAFFSKYIRQYNGTKYFPYQCKVVENKLIITGYFNDSLCRINKLLPGDVITHINGTPTEILLSEKLAQTAGSNPSFKLRNIANQLLTGNSDSVNITVERRNQLFNVTISRYEAGKYHYKWNDPKWPDREEIDSSTGYVYMGDLKPGQVKKTMKGLMDKKAIIFDLRCYPQGTGRKIARYLCKEKSPFSVFITPDLTFPGIFYRTEKQYCGKRQNRNYYKGKVIVLLNESTISQAEYTCMAFRTLPDVTFIGSQTAGADGDVLPITFPGGYKTYFSGLGVFYPDGKSTQRIGIIPDIEVKPTIEGIRSGKDEVFEKAIEFINRKDYSHIRILTEDIANFWIAYDRLRKCNDIQDSLRSIKELYFDKGTAGFKEFINKYHYTPQDYLAAIKKYSKFFTSIHDNTLLAYTIENELTQFFKKVREYYPAYKPLTICFLISPLQCGGTTANNYLFIGTEITASTKEADLSEFGGNEMGKILAFDTNVRERLLFIIAHETVHDLQRNADFDNYELLNRSLTEGSADFIAELFTGVRANHYLYDYGNSHEPELWKAFKKAIENNENTDNWMYNYDRVAEGVPADLGYYIGYRIAESYYNTSMNKKQAIRDIIEMKNPTEFLEKSGYYMKP
jgi:carboxyl-terminal processing protease